MLIADASYIAIGAAVEPPIILGNHWNSFPGNCLQLRETTADIIENYLPFIKHLKIFSSTFSMIELQSS